MYKYKPIRFYLIVFSLTWAFWIPAAFVPEEYRMLLMLLGLFVPAVTAMTTVLTSKSDALKADLKAKLVGAFRVKPFVVIIAVVSFFAIIAASILLSTFAGQTWRQFSFVAGFSFSIGGSSALLTIVLAALLEELGWRGYAEDAIASYHNWFTESLIFGLVWAAWHMPLFFIEGTYHYNILQQSPLYMVNFFVSIMPLGFIVTWVYVKNERSIFACMIFHFFVNLLQEKVAMTQITKCVETLVLFAVAAIVIIANREMFFEKRHIGRLLEDAHLKKGRIVNEKG
ncbi:MAG: CPBP family intramembrane metalloprotease [Gracilibacteraceae bacterium]|jgi:membrane protease YdiL (CAAX protease family)|nr:CPBP family intramembrane metalloprotease [Gracilibacteraceae bacterium]